MLMELLYAHADARPADTALVYRDQRISFAELVERIERLAQGLAERGIGPGDAGRPAPAERPDVHRELAARSPALGAIVVPVNPAFKQDELEFHFRSCDVSGGHQRRAQRRRVRADRRRASTSRSR